MEPSLDFTRKKITLWDPNENSAGFSGSVWCCTGSSYHFIFFYLLLYYKENSGSLPFLNNLPGMYTCIAKIRPKFSRFQLFCLIIAFCLSFALAPLLCQDRPFKCMQYWSLKESRTKHLKPTFSAPNFSRLYATNTFLPILYWRTVFSPHAHSILNGFFFFDK